MMVLEAARVISGACDCRLHHVIDSALEIVQNSEMINRRFKEKGTGMQLNMRRPNGTIVKVALTTALADTETRQSIEEIARATYSNAAVLLEQEYKKNNEVYLFREDGTVLGFFMVGWSRVPGMEGSTVFLGLSCVSAGLRGRGTGKVLYQAFLDDARLRHALTKEPIVWWAHTATPAAVNGFFRLAEGFSPRPDGSHQMSHLAHLDRIESHYGITPYRCETHPFVLRGYAKARYAEEEVGRIKTFKEGDGYDGLLARFHIDETAGDRLMLVGHISTS